MKETRKPQWSEAHQRFFADVAEVARRHPHVAKSFALAELQDSGASGQGSKVCVRWGVDMNGASVCLEWKDA